MRIQRGAVTVERFSQRKTRYRIRNGYVGWTGGWLRTSRESGFEAIERTFLELLDGRIDPARGHVLSPG